MLAIRGAAVVGLRAVSTVRLYERPLWWRLRLWWRRFCWTMIGERWDHLDPQPLQHPTPVSGDLNLR